MDTTSEKGCADEDCLSPLSLVGIDSEGGHGIQDMEQKPGGFRVDHKLEDFEKIKSNMRLSGTELPSPWERARMAD